MKYLKYIGGSILLLICLYLIGPKVHFDPIDLDTPPVNYSLNQLDSVLAASEAIVPDLKPNNEAKIVWADTLKTKTPYVLIYLHGFSASHEEGAPLHTDFAKRYGMNLLLTRLEDHGRSDKNTFINLTPDNFFESAQHALELGKKLGDSIIIMSCSTGSTLSIMLDPTCDLIAGNIMYSPNIDIKDPTSALLVKPWGKNIMDLVIKGEYRHVEYTPLAQKYWNTDYHTNGLLALKTIIVDHMTEEHFKKFTKPFFMGYYDKDEQHQDDVVSIPAMMSFYEQAGTKEPFKRKVNFPEAGAHVISSHAFSKDLEHIRSETYKFAEEVLHLKPIK
ncbi:MAG: alpha/beta hydrolase [Saprospiraceae bacterium]|nr:alpha/beta hydrolase [Saprospiraceae bacterium]